MMVVECPKCKKQSNALIAAFATIHQKKPIDENVRSKYMCQSCKHVFETDIIKHTQQFKDLMHKK